MAGRQFPIASSELIWTPSDNFGPRKDGAVPDLVVIHYTAMADCAAALRALRDPVREVSAHYLISEQGEIFHLIEEAHRAWHAGQGAWGECRDINSRSIGIELSNTGFAPFAAAQMEALTGLLKGIAARWDIAPERVIGHSDCAPGRKIDPGKRFDWQRLAREGLAVWPQHDQQQTPDVNSFLKLAARAGYTATASPADILHAVRLRLRHGASGPLCAQDMAAISGFAREFPVDRAAPSA